MSSRNLTNARWGVEFILSRGARKVPLETLSLRWAQQNGFCWSDRWLGKSSWQGGAVGWGNAWSLNWAYAGIQYGSSIYEQPEADKPEGLIHPLEPKDRGCFNVRNEVFVILSVGNRIIIIISSIYIYYYYYYYYLQYWGLNSGPTPWATPPTLLLWWVFFLERVSQTICMDWLLTAILWCLPPE
jgi:hypothetical protein